MKYGNNDVDICKYIDDKNNTNNVYSIKRIIKEKDKADVIQVENLDYSHSSDISSTINDFSSFERDFAVVPQLEYTTIELNAKFDMRTARNNGDNKLAIQVNYTDDSNDFYTLHHTGVTFDYNPTNRAVNKTYSIPNGKIVSKILYVHQTHGATGSPCYARLYGKITMKGTQ